MKKTKRDSTQTETGAAKGSPGRAERKLGKLKLDLNPGLRDRLFQQLDESNIPEDERLGYLCLLTGRAPQTVRRWIDKTKAGLPDLMSFAVLCVRFDTDANWLLGLTDVKYHLPKSGAAGEDDGKADERRTGWAEEFARQLSDKARGCQPFLMPGDEMEPRIQKGALVFIDPTVTMIQGNGIYALEYKERTTIRIVEDRIGEGLVLSCENKQYKDTVVKDPAAVKKLGLKVIGKAEFWVQMATA